MRVLLVDRPAPWRGRPVFVSPPDDLYVSRTGEIRCINHMPAAGSYEWTFGAWRLLSTAERATLASHRALCRMCAAKRPHTGHTRSPKRSR